MEDKNLIIEEIKVLITSSDEDVVEINPNFLEYFELDELIEMRDNLIHKKRAFKKTSLDFVNELYEKTKKDEI